MDLYIAGFWVLLTGLSALAWARRDRQSGGRTAPRQPELLVAAMFWIAGLLSAALRPSLSSRFAFYEPALLVIDFGLFAGLAWVGARSGKWWVLCTAALQLLSASAHIALLVTPSMWRLGYQVMEEASSYPLLVLLGYGIISRHLSRKSDARSRTYSSDPPIGSATRSE